MLVNVLITYIILSFTYQVFSGKIVNSRKKIKISYP